MGISSAVQTSSSVNQTFGHLLQVKVQANTSREGLKPRLTDDTLQAIKGGILGQLIAQKRLEQNEKYVLYPTEEGRTLNIIWGDKAIDIWEKQYQEPTDDLPKVRANDNKINRVMSSVYVNGLQDGLIPLGRQDFDFEKALNNDARELNFAKNAFNSIRKLSKKGKEFYNLTLSFFINDSKKTEWVVKDDTLELFPSGSLKPSKKEA